MCPVSRGVLISGVVMYTNNRVFGTAKCVLFIEVSSFQGVLNKGFYCSMNTI